MIKCGQKRKKATFHHIKILVPVQKIVNMKYMCYMTIQVNLCEIYTFFTVELVT